jgi:hypothetical protein
MRLRSTQILDLLNEKPGRYIHHAMGRYQMKEASGADVRLTEDGKEYPVEPTAEQMDGLMDLSKLVRDGSKYSLP